METKPHPVTTHRQHHLWCSVQIIRRSLIETRIRKHGLVKPETSAPPTTSKDPATTQVAPGSVVTRLRNNTARWQVSYRFGGEGGIRTRGECKPTHAFQACPLGHSGTSPNRRTPQASPIVTASRRSTSYVPATTYGARTRSLPTASNHQRARCNTGRANFLANGHGIFCDKHLRTRLLQSLSSM